MPYIPPTTTPVQISLDDFIELVKRDVDLLDEESVLSAADYFAGLAADKSLIPNYFNREIVEFLRGRKELSVTGPQSITMGVGPGFYLRANVWQPSEQTVLGKYEDRLYSYGDAHDHNFCFLTVGYMGSGYETELFEYDYKKVDGFIGEKVDLKYLGRECLTPGKVMLFREKYDVHIQFPPKALSVSLNLMTVGPKTLQLDQYYFDVNSGTIIDTPEFASIHKRASIVSLAGLVGDANTIQLLVDLLERTPCRRVREAAVGAIIDHGALNDEERILLLEKQLIRETDKLVRHKIATFFSDLANTN